MPSRNSKRVVCITRALWALRHCAQCTGKEKAERLWLSSAASPHAGAQQENQKTHSIGLLIMVSGHKIEKESGLEISIVES